MLTFSNLASGIYICLCIIIRCYLCVLEKLKMGKSNSLQGRSKLDNWWGTFVYSCSHTIKTTDFNNHKYINISPLPNYRACYSPGVNVLWTLLISSEYAYTPILMINPLGASCSKAN